MSKQAEAGKGSAPRQKQDRKSYEENYSKIFGPSKLEQRLQKEKRDEKR